MKLLWIALALVLLASTYATATLHLAEPPAKTGVIDQSPVRTTVLDTRR